MALRDLTDREAVLRAVAEYEELGPDAFLSAYGFRPARRYFLEVDGRRYAPKAIVAAAHGYQFPDQGPLRADRFVGGLTTVVPKLRSLGFSVVDPDASAGTRGGSAVPSLELGRFYSWEELGDLFGFEPVYITRVGGMVSRPVHGAILLITHPAALAASITATTGTATTTASLSCCPWSTASDRCAASRGGRVSAPSS
jgi:hypothetical protein